MKWLVVLQFFVMVHACSNEESRLPTQQQVNRGMESVNTQMMREESAQIDGYAERKQWQMTTTGTGLRYMIYEKGSGEKAEPGRYATVAYEVSLLDGTVVYSSEQSGTQEFLIGQDNVESGLHEGITYMHTGDKAKFILPSHLAHGIAGDQNKIPPRSSVVYDIHLLGLR